MSYSKKGESPIKHTLYLVQDGSDLIRKGGTPGGTYSTFQTVYNAAFNLQTLGSGIVDIQVGNVTAASTGNLTLSPLNTIGTVIYNTIVGANLTAGTLIIGSISGATGKIITNNNTTTITFITLTGEFVRGDVITANPAVPGQSVTAVQIDYAHNTSIHFNGLSSFSSVLGNIVGTNASGNGYSINIVANKIKFGTITSNGSVGGDGGSVTYSGTDLQVGVITTTGSTGSVLGKLKFTAVVFTLKYNNILGANLNPGQAFRDQFFNTGVVVTNDNIDTLTYTTNNNGFFAGSIITANPPVGGQSITVTSTLPSVVLGNTITGSPSGATGIIFFYNGRDSISYVATSGTFATSDTITTSNGTTIQNVSQITTGAGGSVNLSSTIFGGLIIANITTTGSGTGAGGSITLSRCATTAFTTISSIGGTTGSCGAMAISSVLAATGFLSIVQTKNGATPSLLSSDTITVSDSTVGNINSTNTSAVDLASCTITNSVFANNISFTATGVGGFSNTSIKSTKILGGGVTFTATSICNNLTGSTVFNDVFCSSQCSITHSGASGTVGAFTVNDSTLNGFVVNQTGASTFVGAVRMFRTRMNSNFVATLRGIQTTNYQFDSVNFGSQVTLNWNPTGQPIVGVLYTNCTFEFVSNSHVITISGTPSAINGDVEFDQCQSSGDFVLTNNATNGVNGRNLILKSSSVRFLTLNGSNTGNFYTITATNSTGLDLTARAASPVNGANINMTLKSCDFGVIKAYGKIGTNSRLDIIDSRITQLVLADSNTPNTTTTAVLNLTGSTILGGQPNGLDIAPVTLVKVGAIKIINCIISGNGVGTNSIRIIPTQGVGLVNTPLDLQLHGVKLNQSINISSDFYFSNCDLTDVWMDRYFGYSALIEALDPTSHGTVYAINFSNVDIVQTLTVNTGASLRSTITNCPAAGINFTLNGGDHNVTNGTLQTIGLDGQTTYQYQIISFAPGDDFTVSGAPTNNVGETFTYNGTPPIWSNGSVLHEFLFDLNVISVRNSTTGISVNANTPSTYRALIAVDNSVSSVNLNSFAIAELTISNSSVSGITHGGTPMMVINAIDSALGFVTAMDYGTWKNVIYTGDPVVVRGSNNQCRFYNCTFDNLITTMTAATPVVIIQSNCTHIRGKQDSNVVDFIPRYDMTPTGGFITFLYALNQPYGGGILGMPQETHGYKIGDTLTGLSSGSTALLTSVYSLDGASNVFVYTNLTGPGFSNSEIIVVNPEHYPRTNVVSTAPTFAAGVLTLDSSAAILGKAYLINPTGANITSIVEISSPSDLSTGKLIELRSGTNSDTVLFTGTPVATPIVAGQIAMESAGSVTLTGRSTVSDFLILRNDNGIFRQISASVLV